MSWAFRVVQETDDFGHVHFAIKEVRFEDGKPTGASKANLDYESMDDLQWALRKMWTASTMPVIKFENGKYMELKGA